LAKTYVRETSVFLRDNGINQLSSILGEGPSATEVEPEVDSLLEIYKLSPTQRLRLIEVIHETMELDNSSLAEEIVTSDPDEHDFPARKYSCADSIKKLRRHLMGMPMILEDEELLRRLYRAMRQIVGMSGLFEYIEKHPGSLNYRTTSVLVYCGELMDDPERYRRGAFSSDWWKVPEVMNRIRNELRPYLMSPRWYERFIPQRDGWALAMGDYLDELSADEQCFWEKLLEISREGNTAKPSKKFSRLAEAFRAADSEIAFVGAFKVIVTAMNTSSPVLVWDEKKGFREESMYDQSSQLMLRGIVRLSFYYASPETLEVLEQMMNRCFEKIVGIGPRAEALGQEILDVISKMDTAGNTECLERGLAAHKTNKNVKARFAKAVESVRNRQQ
jgi:hypothetical protein